METSVTMELGQDVCGSADKDSAVAMVCNRYLACLKLNINLIGITIVSTEEF